jgi:predicted HicB family RNase H-like nuclease
MAAEVAGKSLNQWAQEALDEAAKRSLRSAES